VPASTAWTDTVPGMAQSMSIFVDIDVDLAISGVSLDSREIFEQFKPDGEHWAPWGWTMPIEGNETHLISHDTLPAGNLIINCFRICGGGTQSQAVAPLSLCINSTEADFGVDVENLGMRGRQVHFVNTT
jgi:hypothetical protein